MAEKLRPLTTEEAMQVFKQLNMASYGENLAVRQEIARIIGTAQPEEEQVEDIRRVLDRHVADCTAYKAFEEGIRVTLGLNPPELTQLTTGILRFNLSEAEEADNQRVQNI